MVTLEEFQDEDRITKGVNQMEMMFVLGALMSMMVTSLALQHTSYRKVRVSTK